MTLNTNISPYYDDYDETKDFYRILFRPGRAVQARELTQAQTILQTQLNRHASHIFANGSIVTGGALTYQKEYPFVKLASYTWSDSLWESQIKNSVIIGGTSNAKAKVVNFLAAETTTLTGTVTTNGTVSVSGSGTKFLEELEIGSHLTINGEERSVTAISSNTALTVGATYTSKLSGATATKTDPAAIFVQYLTGSSSTTAAVFADGETLTVGSYSSVTAATNANLTPTTSTGNGSAINISDGIFFHDGTFLRVGSQTTILDRFGSTPTYRIGLVVTESIVTSSDATYGSSLLDPAQGFSNYQAVGADRYQITMVLTKKSINESTDGSFIELMQVSSGGIRKQIKYPIYSEIEKTLARRTYAESGNYTVDAFPLSVKNHDSDTSKFVVALGPGSAYIQGHEFHNDITQKLNADRARDTNAVTGADTFMQYGKYFIVDTVSGFFDTDSFEAITLKDSGGSSIGSAKVRQFIHRTGTPGTSSTNYKMYLFDFAFSGNNGFKDVKSVLGDTNAATASIASDGENSDSETILFDTQTNSLVFQMPNNSITQSTITNVSYQIRRTFTGTFSAGGVLSINTGEPGQSFFGAGTTLNSTSGNLHYHVVKTSDGTVANFNGSGDSIVVGSTSVTFTKASDTSLNSAAVKIIATVNIDYSTSQGTKTKTLVESSTSTIAGSTDLTLGQVVINTGYDASSIDLQVSDIYNLVAVYEETDGDGVIDANTIASAKDITSRFTLDNGQRDNLYDHGSINLKAGQTAPTKKLLVLIDYFSQAGDGYYTVDSYVGSGLTDEYGDIPTFTSPTTGNLIHLRDAIDFRPTRKNLDSTVIVDPHIPYPNVNFECDYSYYLPRIDKVYLDKQLSFGIKKGSSADVPKEPEDYPDSMTLFVLEIPAYTSNVKRIGIRYVDNRRFTMKQIGNIEKRVSRLEYYASLSLLEKDTDALIIKDSAGLERFKNGILVDAFKGHNIGDVRNTDYACSIDMTNNELRPAFTISEVDMRSSYSSGDSSGVSKTGDLVTLSFTEETLINQDKASKKTNINPFNVTSFIGNMDLNPPNDTWVDTTTRPAVTINLEGENDAWEYISNNLSSSGFETEWNNWSTIWVGESTTATERISRTTTGRRHDPATQGMQRIETDVIERTTTETRKKQTRSGISSTFAPESITREIGNRVVDVSIIPYIRSQNITVSVTGMKPNTQVYPFFDSEDVSAYCNSGNNIYTDNAGTVSFTFAVPSATFETGDRLFRLIDSSTNDVSSASTFAETKFQAQGLMQTQQNTIISTRVPSIRRETVTEEQFVTDVFQRDALISSTVRYVDPISQTFLVDESVYPKGLFISSADIYFAAKPTSTSEQLPVTLQIRETNNGYPGQVVVPFSTKTLTPSEVNIPSADADYASTSTTFTFDSPVYLGPGEYALTLITNSQDYEVYTAEMGGTILGTERLISQQPYAGSLFKSQNASTWTAEQNEDLAFKLKKCLFGTSGTAVFKNPTNTPSSNVLMDVGILQSQEIQLRNAVNTWSIKTTGRANDTLSSYTTVSSNTNIDFTTQKIVKTTAGTFVARSSMSTDNTDVSPAIDVQRLSLLAVENLINNQTTDETNANATPADGASAYLDTSSGGSRARYITRRITLDLESNDLKVFLDGNRPAGTDIKVYYKVLASSDETRFDDRPFVQMELESGSPDKYSTDSNEFIEYAFVPSGANDIPATGISYTASGAQYTSFTTFAIKIVLTSSETAIVPRVKNLRVIALAP